MPFDLNVQNCNELVDLLYLNKDWCRIFFRIKGVKKYKITAFFFQLFVTKILSFKLVCKNVVSYVITRHDNGKFLYGKTEIWEGMKFRTKKRRGGTVEFKDIVAAQEKAVEILDNFWSSFYITNSLISNLKCAPAVVCIDAFLSPLRRLIL